MTKISLVSKYICALLLALAILQVTSHALLLCFGELTTEGLSQLSIDFYLFSSHISHQFPHGWLDISQALMSENFNALAILGTAELIPYLLIYYFLFKLFSYYQRGQIFTVANIACLRNIGKTLLLWILLNAFYPVLVSLIIRFTGLSNKLAIYLNIGSSEIVYLISGLVIYVMAWVMTLAIELKQEQELVV
ncbi:hypothetical protein NBRC116592_13330 [Colwellia sp. KU-HH00111]|uniref:DUF2975 domain-containing protein n=1 Tax=Colwellia sp. KU-HH00111 TaxID=3127652 RepID=UPI00310A1AFE